MLERIQFYLADDVPETPMPRSRHVLLAAEGQELVLQEDVNPRQRRGPVASLAESLEALTSILLQITASLKDLQERTEGMETTNWIVLALSSSGPASERDAQTEKFCSFNKIAS